MRVFERIIAVSILAGVLTGCAVSKNFKDARFVPTKNNYTVVLMKPDVKVGSLNAGGVFELNKDWSEAARSGLYAALQKTTSSRGGSLKPLSVEGADPSLTDTIVALEHLNRAVGNSIFIHKFGPATLPSKKGKFDWTLGLEAQTLARSQGAEYGLFLSARDSFSTGGRVALQALGWAGCAVGVCMAISGGEQTAYASLVDLSTGNIVWFNAMEKPTGDIRTATGADALVRSLLKSAPFVSAVVIAK